MGILTTPDLTRLLQSRELIIESLDPQQPFDPAVQVTEDGIDLRLGLTALKYRQGVNSVDTLFEADLPSCFEQFEIPIDGYSLKPGDVLFASTMEVVCLATSAYTGYVIGRSTFARFGMSVHCTQPKCPAGIAWTFPLQLVNHNRLPLVVYPYSYIVQLQIDHTFGPAVGYDERYDADVTIKPPKITERELRSVIAVREAPQPSQGTSRIETSEVESLIADFSVREARRKKLRTTAPRSRRRAITAEVVAGTASAVAFGVFGSLVTNPLDDHYKSLSAGLSLVLGLFLLIALIFVKHTQTE
jgi:dCTP deaminase